MGLLRVKCTVWQDRRSRSFSPLIPRVVSDRLNRPKGANEVGYVKLLRLWKNLCRRCMSGQNAEF